MSNHSPQEQAMPASILRHRPIHSDLATDNHPVVPRASRRPPASQHTKQPTSAVSFERKSRLRRRGAHWLLFVGLGMLLALVLGMLGHVAYAWGSLTWDDLHYGRPRTFQVDAFVGHETTQQGPSHFIALNLHGRIEIIEFPGGDGTHARIFLGPQLYGDHTDLVPVTLHFVDTRHNHHPDMVVTFGQSHLVFRNEQGTFRPSA